MGTIKWKNAVPVMTTVMVVAAAANWESSVSRNLSGETVFKASTHFDIRKKATHDDGSPNNPSPSETQLNSGLSTLEAVWTKYHDQIGFVEPEANSTTKYKVRVYLFQNIDALYGGADSYGPAMWLGLGALADRWGLAHEYTHGLQTVSGGLRDSRYTGWFHESHANWMAHQFISSDVHCSEMLVNYPYVYYGSTRNRYCNWQYLEYLKDRYDYTTVNEIWTRSLRQNTTGYRDETPFTALMRNQGWSVADFNDDFGHWAMRNVTWDYGNGSVYRSRYGSYDNRDKVKRNRVTMLDSLDATRTRFVSPSYWSPQPLGYNLVRLYPDNAGQNAQITVKFRGITQQRPTGISYGSYQLEPSAVTDPNADWRWGLVAVDAAGNPRYSALQKGASADLNFALQGSDQALWMVVVATPSQYTRIFWDQIYYSIYRYPYRIEVQGAKPEGFQAGAWNPPTGTAGSRHANGGGWVANTATVAATAYVGPNAKVLNNAQVTGAARLEGFAVVGGSARVYDNAIIRDQGRVLGSGRVYGNAVVGQHASVYAGEVYGSAQIGALTLIDGGKVYGNAQVYSVMNALGNNQVMSGTAQMRGDTEYNFTNISSGVFYGIVNDNDAVTANYGANRTAPAAEVTSTVIPPWPQESSSSSASSSASVLSSSSAAASSSSVKSSSSAANSAPSSSSSSSSLEEPSSSSEEPAFSSSSSEVGNPLLVRESGSGTLALQWLGQNRWQVHLPQRNGTLKLFSVKGQLHRAWNIHGQEYHTIDVSALPIGIYWLEVQVGSTREQTLLYRN